MSVISTTPYIVETETFPAPSSDETGYAFTITWTNLGPLTTTFTPPAACKSSSPDAIWVYTSDSVLGSYLVSAPCYIAQSTVPNSRFNCRPSGPAYASVVSDNYSKFLTWQTYMSPGISCPSGMTTANNVTLAPSDVSTTSHDAYTIHTTGTHVWCCQSGYKYIQSSYGCVSDITTATSTSLCAPFCETNCYSPASSTGSSSCSTDDCAIPTLYSLDPSNHSVVAQAYADAIYMIHQESDIPKGGLSTGAKIAIGVVVPVVVLLAITAGALIFMRRLRKKRAANPNNGISAGAGMQEARQGGPRVIQNYEPTC